MRYVAVGALATAIVIGAVVFGGGGGGGGGTFMANLFTSAVTGSASCTRHSTVESYAQAVTNGNVCAGGAGNTGDVNATPWDNACVAAQTGSGGTIIGVKADGTYPRVASNGALLGDPGYESANPALGCGQSGATDYDPNCDLDGNACGAKTGWATFECADGETAGSVAFPSGGVVFIGVTFHAEIQGNCFGSTTTGAGGFGALNMSPGGSTVASKDLIIDAPAGETLGLTSLEIAGCIDCLLQNARVGPSVLCGTNTAFVPSAWRCDPAGPPFEARYASNGSPDSICRTMVGGVCGGDTSANGIIVGTGTESYIHDSNAGAPSGVRLQNVTFIDSNDKDTSNPSQIGHPGCILIGASNWAAAALVLDGITCEREATQDIQLDSGGIVIENSTFGCPVDIFRDVGTVWDHCNSAQGGVIVTRADIGCPSGTQSNILIRNNVFLPGAVLRFDDVGYGCTYSNVRIVGNIIGSSLECSVTGVTYDNNAFWNGASTCGTNSTALGGDPFVASSTSTSDHLWRGVTQVDAHASGAFALPTFADNGSNTGDLNLKYDVTGAVRSNPTHVGIYK